MACCHPRLTLSEALVDLSGRCKFLLCPGTFAALSAWKVSLGRYVEDGVVVLLKLHSVFSHGMMFTYTHNPTKILLDIIQSPARAGMERKICQCAAYSNHRLKVDIQRSLPAQ